MVGGRTRATRSRSTPPTRADRTTGAVYTLQVGRHRRPRRRAQPAGRVEHLRDRWSRASGCASTSTASQINDFTNTDPARNLDGYIGIQNHGAGDDAAFRNIRIKELAAPAARRRDRAGRVVQLGERRAGVHQGRRQQRPDARLTSTRATGRPYNGVNVGGVDLVPGARRLRRAGRHVQVRTGSTTGPILGTVAVPNTGSWTTFADVSDRALTGVPSGTANVYLTFTGTGTGTVRRRRLHVRQVRRPRPAPGRSSGLAGQVPGRAQRRDRRRHEDPALDLQRLAPRRPWTRTGPDAAGAGQVPRRLRQRHRRRHEDPALDLQRHRRAELGAGRERIAREPELEQVSGRLWQQLRRLGSRSTSGPATAARTSAGPAP